MHRISSLTKGIAGMKEGPEPLALALSKIDQAARTFWKQARAYPMIYTSPCLLLKLLK